MLWRAAERARERERATEETSVLSDRISILRTAVKASELVSAGGVRVAAAPATLTIHSRRRDATRREGTGAWRDTGLGRATPVGRLK